LQGDWSSDVCSSDLLSVADEIVTIACEVRPHQATLVPERREELTTEGGLDVVAHQAAVAKAMKRLHKAGIPVALFVDPDLGQIEASRKLGAKAVEIQTARYSEAKSDADRLRELNALQESTDHAKRLGLNVHMGHGLNYY